MNRKKTYIHILTLLAMFAIAISDVTTDIWHATPEINIVWDFYGWITVATRWGLPLLIATFGMAVFNNDMSLSNNIIYRKILPQAMISCCVWWSVSALIYLKTNFPNEIDIDTFLECMSYVLEPPYNVCFLQMVVVFFAFYPLLSRIIKDDKLLTYAVAINFLICSVFPLLANIPYVRVITLFTNQINWNFFTPYALYLFIGIWASRKNFEWHNRILIYCLGVFSTVAMFTLTKIFSAGILDVDSRFMNDNSPFIAFQILALITGFKQLFKSDVKNNFVKSTLSELSKNRYAYVATYMIGFGFINNFASENNTILLIIATYLFINGLCLFCRRLPIISYLLSDYEDVR